MKEKFIKRKYYPYIKWVVYYLLLIIFFSLQTTPHLFEVFSVKPVFVFPLFIAVAMFEDVVPSAVFAIFAGLLWDISSDKIFGFNALIFLVISVLISLFCIYFLHVKITNFLIFTLASMLLQGLLNYFFYFSIWNYKDTIIVLTKSILPTCVYSTIISIFFFYMVQKINCKFDISE